MAKNKKAQDGLTQLRRAVSESTSLPRSLDPRVKAVIAADKQRTDAIIKEERRRKNQGTIKSSNKPVEMQDTRSLLNDRRAKERADAAHDFMQKASALAQYVPHPLVSITASALNSAMGLTDAYFANQEGDVTNRNINLIGAIPIPTYGVVKQLGRGLGKKFEDKATRAAIMALGLDVYGTAADLTDNFGNSKKQQGGAVPKAQEGGSVESRMGGLTDKGFNYNGAWGGTMQMGGVLPGAIGNMYARHGAPSEGKYAKKTMASAQDGKTLPTTTIKKEPIYVDNPNDPRLRAYNDSLALYNKTLKTLSGAGWIGTPEQVYKSVIEEDKSQKEWLKKQSKSFREQFEKEANIDNRLPKLVKAKTVKGIKPISWRGLMSVTEDPSTWSDATPIYPKPVQPVKYRKPQPKKETPAAKPPVSQEKQKPVPAPKVEEKKTQYSFTYPTFDKDVQKTIYFPTQKALKEFTDKYGYTSREFTDSSGSATGYYTPQFEQGGKMMSYYQAGLDFQPKTISEDGSEISPILPNEKYETYDIQKGDTLSNIASKYNVPLATLAGSNQLENPNLIVAGKTLNIPKQPKKELTFEEIPTSDKKKIIIDNFSKHYDYIVEGDNLYYKVKGGKTWADISENKKAQKNLLDFINKNNYWAGYSSGEKQLYQNPPSPKPQGVSKKPLDILPINNRALSDATLVRKDFTKPTGKKSHDTLEEVSENIKAGISTFAKITSNIAKEKAKSVKREFDKTIDDTKESIKSGINQTVENVDDFITTIENGIRRKYATHTGEDEDTKVPSSSVKNNIPRTVSEYYNNQSGLKLSAVIDTPDKTGRQFKQQTLPLSAVKLAPRNRGEYKDITTDGLEVTTFHPFTKEKLPDNATVLAIDPNGNLKTGRYADFKNDKSLLFSRTYRNNIVDFSEKDGKLEYVSGKKSGNPKYNQPKVKVLGDDGKIKDGSLNVLVKDDSKKDYYGSIQGGRILFVNPETKEQYLVSGSVSHIKNEFKRLKGNAKYLEAYTLDNGTYSRGLSYKDKKLTPDRLKSYDLENTSGGNGLYILDYKKPVNNYPEEYVENMPNVRTEKDESYRKGHPLKNELKNVVLHHTAYTNPATNERQVREQFMKPGQNSSHVVIEEDGKRTIYASPEQVTFHAGESMWNNRSNVNDFSVGVEFQGDTNRKPLTNAQIESFIEYYAPIARDFNISVKDIITHQMIAGGRKPDISKKDYDRILKTLKDKGFKKNGGGIKKDDAGYWNPENWGEPVEIDSNEITMEGVYEPLIGVSDTGDVQYMEPGENYTFDGESVTEYPVMQKGGRVPIYTENPNDPRIKAYQDSLKLYNEADYFKNIGEFTPFINGKQRGRYFNNYLDNNFSNGIIVPIGARQSKDKNNQDIVEFPVYKKPVQPVKYRKPQPKAKEVVSTPPIMEQPSPKPSSKTYKGESVFAPTPYGGGGAGALVGFRDEKTGKITYIEPQDYERFGVPKYGKQYIEQATTAEKLLSPSMNYRNGGGINQLDEAPLKKLDNLLNFTNYNDMKKAKKGKNIPKAQAGIGAIGNPAFTSAIQGAVDFQGGYNDYISSVDKKGKGAGMSQFSMPGSLGASPLAKDIEFIGMAKQALKERKKAKQSLAVSEVVKQAATMRPDIQKRKYVRPEDNLLQPDQMGMMPYGGGYDVLGMAENGMQIGGNLTEIQNMYNPGTLYDNLGYEPLDESSKVKQYKKGGGVPKAQTGMEVQAAMEIMNVATGLRNRAILGAINKKTEKWTDLANQNLQQGAMNQALQTQFSPFMKNGGSLDVSDEYKWISHSWQPQVITKFGEHNVKDLLKPDPMMDTLRTGGNIRSNYMGDDEMVRSMAMGGNLQTHWGGEGEVMSYNPYMPGSGETVMLKGNSHEESDGQGNTGVGMSYSGNMVEAERGEPVVEMQEGGSVDDTSAVVFGNMKIPSYGISELGDNKAKGKKFKSYAADLAKQEQKQSKIVDKATKMIDNIEGDSPYDMLKMNSAQAMIMGADMSLKDLANKKKTLAGVQNAILETAEEMGLESDALARGKMVQAKKGANIPKGQQGYEAVGKWKDIDFPDRYTVPPGISASEYKDVVGKYAYAPFTTTPFVKPAGVDTYPLYKMETEGTPTKEEPIIPIEGMENDEKAGNKIKDFLSQNEGLFSALYNEALPYLRPSNQMQLQPEQLMGEMFALSTNVLQGVPAQTYQPLLETRAPQMSAQEQLNQNQADFNAMLRQVGNNPAALSVLAAQKQAADRQAIAQTQAYNTQQAIAANNRNIAMLNDASLKNLGILDTQYQRQEGAKANTKAQAQAALSSIASKIGQNKLENLMSAVMQNMYNFRFGPKGRIINYNPLAQFNTSQLMQYLTPEMKEELAKQLSPEKKRNGSIVKAIKGL